ncbi:hypothetical protein ACQ4LE_011173 [Meloidogyne hapla]
MNRKTLKNENLQITKQNILCNSPILRSSQQFLMTSIFNFSILLSIINNSITNFSTSIRLFILPKKIKCLFILGIQKTFKSRNRSFHRLRLVKVYYIKIKSKKTSADNFAKSSTARLKSKNSDCCRAFRAH